jgi:hypothetical protein
MPRDIHNHPYPFASGEQPSAPCPRCAFPSPHTPGSGAGPHHARLTCGQCGAFPKWLPKPRPAVQEMSGSPIPKAERLRQLTTWCDVAPRWTPQPILPQEGQS